MCKSRYHSRDSGSLQSRLRNLWNLSRRFPDPQEKKLILAVTKLTWCLLQELLILCHHIKNLMEKFPGMGYVVFSQILRSNQCTRSLWFTSTVVQQVNGRQNRLAFLIKRCVQVGCPHLGWWCTTEFHLHLVPYMSGKQVYFQCTSADWI